MNNLPHVSVFDDHRKMSLALMRLICRLAAHAADARQRFSIALSGGSLIDVMAGALGPDFPNDDVDWSKWHVFWADERCVPWQSPESNHGEAQKHFLSRVPIPARQVHAMDTSQPPDEAARHYATVLDRVLKPGPGQYPRFDLILLGIGPDGHTASLFPDHPVLHATRAWVSAVTGAPKPPSDRLTLTLPVINQARHIVWVASGPEKADIVARILNPSPKSMALPAGRVKPSRGDARWYLDRKAASGIHGR